VDEVSDDDIERLASRLAMLVSDDGEADNAGRAVGLLARRLGVSGGEIKEMFLAGAAARALARPASPEAEEAERLQREVATLRHSLELIEVNARVAKRERDALQCENASLQRALDNLRLGRRARLAFGTVVMAAAAAIVVGWVAPIIRLPAANPPPQADHATPFSRLAVVRSGHTLMYRQPDPDSPVVGTIPFGTKLAVRSLRWNMLMQWVEIELGGEVGYVRTTDVDLS
jgi:hypothetical protein